MAGVLASNSHSLGTAFRPKRAAPSRWSEIPAVACSRQNPALNCAQRRAINVRASDFPKEFDAGTPSEANSEEGKASARDPEKSSLPTLWQQGWRLLERTARLVWANAWVVVTLFALCDGAIFLLHRVCHRFTNEVALRFLLPLDQRTPEAIGASLWWLSNNPEVASFQSGYQWVVGAVFLLMFPIGILLRTLAAATAQAILASNLENTGHPGWRPPVKAVWKQLRGSVPDIKPILNRLWQVDLLVAIRAIPLQGLSLLLVPIPWTLPRLLNLQLATTISLFEGEHRDDALRASAKLVQPIRKALAVPYIGLLVIPKLLAFLGRLFLTSLSPRIARDIPEIPIAAYVVLAVATVVLNRVQDLLPLVGYVEAYKAQGEKPKLAVAA